MCQYHCLGQGLTQASVVWWTRDSTILQHLSYSILCHTYHHANLDSFETTSSDEKFQTKIREFRKPVSLDSGRQNVTASTLQYVLQNDIVVSHSGRMLAEILSLSHSKELSLYTVDNIVPSFEKDGTVVCYSCPECEYAVGSSLLPSFSH
jgi:hypothetical protein